VDCGLTDRRRGAARWAPPLFVEYRVTLWNAHQWLMQPVSVPSGEPNSADTVACPFPKATSRRRAGIVRGAKSLSDLIPVI
jgi:hypothetical protein